MIPFIVRRLALLPVILAGVTLLVFALFSQLSAGQRAALYVSDLPRAAFKVGLLITLSALVIGASAGCFGGRTDLPAGMGLAWVGLAT